jgi:hypothetical protein
LQPAWTFRTCRRNNRGFMSTQVFDYHGKCPSRRG